MNSTTSDDRKGQREHWTEINNNIANGLQTIAMLRYEAKGRLRIADKTTKVQHQMTGGRRPIRHDE